MKRKSKTLSNIFPLYPYKKKHASTKTTRPSTTSWEIVDDHELSLTWLEWAKIMRIYLKHLGNFLMSGKAVILPNRMGIFRIYKYKYSDKKAIDFNHYRKTGEKVYFQNNHTNGYGPVVKWHRKRYQGSFRRKWFWMIRFAKTYRTKMAKNYKADPSLLFSYDDTPRN